MKRALSFLFLFAVFVSIEAKQADVSLVVVDFKYNGYDGIKVCEVQPLRISRLSGYYHTHPHDPSYIRQWLGEWFDSFPMPKWAEKSRLGDASLIKVYHDKFTLLTDPQSSLQNDAEFLSHKGVEPADPSHLSAYTGMVYLTGRSLLLTKKLRSDYPSLIFIDEALLPLYGDKLHTNNLFDANPLLASYRPKWGVYDKVYNHRLAGNILETIGSSLVVIKPRNAARGYGVIIVDAKQLDSTLKFILYKSRKLRDHEDPSYSYWYYETNDNFIVEEFIPSDPIQMGGRFYDPTYRYIALLYYTDSTPHIELIDGYAKLPGKALSSQAKTLNDRYKSCGTLPYYASIPSEDEAAIEGGLEECLYLLYTELMQTLQTECHHLPAQDVQNN